jgi:PAS domain S-box-containing protein
MGGDATGDPSARGGATVAGSVPQGLEVRCLITPAVLGFARERGLDEAELLAGVPYAPEHLCDPSRRIDWSSFVRLLRNGAGHLSDDDWAEIGRRMIPAQSSRPFGLLARALYTPAELVEWMGGPSSNVYGLACVRATIRRLARDRLHSETWVLAGYEPCRELFQIARGVAQALPTVLGFPPAVVALTETERGARFDVRLPRSAAWLGPLRRALVRPFSAHTTARQLQRALELLDERNLSLEREIEQRRRAEAALRESEEKLTELMANLDAAFWLTSADGRELLYASPGVAKLLGVEPGTVRPFGWMDFVHPDDLPGLLEKLRSRRRGETLELEHRALLRDGSVRWIRSRIFAIRDGAREVRIGGLAEDVTARRAVEETLRASEERYRRLTENSSDLIVEVDGSGRIVFLSSRAEDTLGAEARAFLGRDASEMVHPDDRDAVRRAFRTTMASQHAGQVTYRQRRPDGSWHWMEASGRQFRTAAGDLHVVIVARDVTERRRMQQELQQHAAELARSAHAKDQFVASLAHELRNPLAAISSAAQLLVESGGADSDERGLERVIERQARHLTRLVDDLLDVARLERGRVELRLERVDVVASVRAAADAMRPEIERHGHRLTLALPPEPLWVDADPVRLEQVLANLLGNAVKYTEPGGGIEISVERQPDAIALRVRDDGVGIPAEELPRIFEGGSPRGRARAIAQGGLGLGLRLVREIVELHGGQVAATSDGEGKGSEFVVRLRALDDAGAEARAAPARRTSGTVHRVLLIEDDADVSATLARLLASWGHSVTVAADGSSGLAAARRLRPDVVLVDIGMPGMSGYEVARTLRAQEHFDGTLVAVTGFGAADDRTRAEHAGFDHHVTKTNVLSALREILADR